MRYEYDSHYSEKLWKHEQEYTTPDGAKTYYHGPNLTWEYFANIAGCLDRIMPRPKSGAAPTLLDIGCSAGDFARYMMRLGWDSYGVDVSEYAVKNAVPEMRGRIQLADATTSPKLEPYYYDLVTGLDCLEHFFEEDIDKLLAWLHGLGKFFFFCVATVWDEKDPLRKIPDREFVAKKGEEIPLKWEATAISGHVNVRHFTYWWKKFTEHGFKIRHDLNYLLQMQRWKMEPWWRTGGWDLPNTIFLEAR